MKKRFLSLLLVLGLIISAVPNKAAAEGRALAAEVRALADGVTIAEERRDDSTGTAKDNELDEKKVTEVLSAVKKKITIPKEYKNFSYYYNAAYTYSNATWNFTWNTEDLTGRIFISSDEKGNIITYNKYIESEKKLAPKYLKAELKDKATQFIKQIAPNIAGTLVYEDSTYSNGRNGSYNYTFIRQEQGIPMPLQQVSVGIDVATGEIVSYINSGWNYEIKIPKKNIQLTKEQATAKISEQINMNLVYHTRYTNDANGTIKRKAYLVYEPSTNYIAVDASTGTIYTTMNQWIIGETTSGEAENQATADKADGGASVLTEEEIKKISELRGLISKAKATEIITKNSNLHLDASAVSITADLNETSDYWNPNGKRYVWNIRLSDPKTPDYKSGDFYRAYTYATVDAKTGEIINFHASYKDYNYTISETKQTTQKVKYSEEQSKNLLEAFIKTQNKDRFAKTKLSATSNQFVINMIDEKEVYGGYHFAYDRVNEGVVYSDNQIYGSVDAVTGKIVSYGYYWDDSIQFESPKNVIGPKEALSAYLKLDGYDMVYELNTTYKENSFSQEPRLVYRTEIYPGFISPFTGKQVNYDGQAYVTNDTNRSYSDIKNHALYRSIQMMVDMGAGFEGSKFYPDQAVTKDELWKMVEAVSYNYYDKKLTGSDKITRQVAAEFAINLLDLKSISQIKGIYKVGSLDESEIGSSYLGSVALAKGLEILSVDKNNKFRPKANLTRAEAADMILKIMATNR